MALFDLPLEQLRAYTPERHEPADFGAFWSDTLAEARAHALNPRFEPVETGLVTVQSFDLTFSGWGGHPIGGWLTLPAQRPAPLACVVEYIGYGGGRGLPHDHLLWASAGYAHLVMDTRGQGSAWRAGDTPDPAGSAPHAPGFMTQGLLDPRTYYYRRVYTDAVRAVEAARSHPAIDPARVAVTGGSQGGGISIAVAGLLPDLRAVLPDVPFLCHFERALTITDSFPYAEIAGYLRVHRGHTAQAMQTLAYFDGLHFAARAKCPALYSVGLMDDVCPPSTVYAAFNQHPAQRRMVEYPFNRHEGGESFQTAEKLAFLREWLQ